jgi:prevent-host-death family protein
MWPQGRDGVTTVGVRELKNRLSEFLRRVADGERITVTDRGRAIALLSPPEDTPETEKIARMVREGLARWGGGKPRGSSNPPKIRGRPISSTVLEERR